MEFNFSHLYKTETVDVMNGDEVVFSATVRQITHGEKSEAQARMLAEVDIPLEGSKARRKREMKQAMKKAMQSGVSTRVSMYEELAAIQSWTLQDADGNDVPVCADAWTSLPSAMANQITEAIERLNPDLDDEFRDDDGDESAD